MEKILRILACLGVLLAVTACGLKGVDITRYGLEDAVIAEDLGLLPQDLTVFAERAGKDTQLMDPARQGREDARFNERFFAAWDTSIPVPPKADVFEGIENMNPDKGFAENLRPYPKDRWNALVANCAADSYGNGPPRPAITVMTAPLRRMPTDSPYFLDPNKGGEGFPFDYMQNSTLWVGTPVAVIHVSLDGIWAFVRTSLVSGWTRVTNLGAVDKNFIKFWQSQPLAVIVQDNARIVLTDKMKDAVTGNRPAVEAGIGTILPFAMERGQVRVAKSPHVYVHVPLRSTDGKAIIATALAPMYGTRQKPLRLTPMNIALTGNAMMGQPYGWGGLFGQRDCSAAMRDLFAPFGIWLPRNSRAQGRVGTTLDVSGLTPEAKEERILRDGTPFFSLVVLPGHVGLYLGGYPKLSGKETREVPVMFHNMWGLRVSGGRGDNTREGRGVIGKAVVTTLRPGAEHKMISSPASILDRVTGLAVLPEPLPGDSVNR